MQFSKLTVVIALMLLVVLAFFYLPKDVQTSQVGSEPKSQASVATNLHPAPAQPDTQDNNAAIAATKATNRDDHTEKQPSQNLESATDADGDTISLEEILSRIHISQDNNVFPQQYQVDMAATARLTELISQLDKDQLQLHVFSAECYHTLNECRVHYQANDSLVLYLMGKFEGMIQIGDQVTESGDTVLMIGYKPLDAANESGADEYRGNNFDLTPFISHSNKSPF